MKDQSDQTRPTSVFKRWNFLFGPAAVGPLNDLESAPTLKVQGISALLQSFSSTDDKDNQSHKHSGKK